MFIDTDITISDSPDFSNHNNSCSMVNNEAETIFNNGDFVIKSPNVMHGHDTFINGQHVTHTESNGIGGLNVYHDGHLTEVAMSNAHGGIDIYDGNMQQHGSYILDVHGGEDYLNLSGNGDAIMKYHDPLAHASEFRMEPFNVNKY